MCTHLYMYIYIPIHTYVYIYSSRIFAFCRLSRPPKGWQKRMAAKAKDPNIPKILQRKFSKAMELRMCVSKANYVLKDRKIS